MVVSLRCFVVLVALLSLAGPAVGDTVEGIYSVRTVVEDRGAATLATARREGLESVLIRASGVADPGERAPVAQALDNPEPYLRSYSYERDEDLWLRLEFDERAVRELMEAAQLPLWTANRPRVLVWLVINEASGRRFVSSSDTPQADEALRDSFRHRGMPMQTPILDLQDAAAINPGEAWRQSSEALVRASQRYGDVQLLAGRVARLSDGSWLGDWQLLDGGRWLKRPASAPSLSAFTDAGADLAVGVFAARYGVTLQDTDNRHRVTLRGIRSYADYQAAQRVLGRLETVRRVVPERLVGDQVSLRIESDADLVQLSRIIELDERFVAATDRAAEQGLFYEFMQ